MLLLNTSATLLFKRSLCKIFQEKEQIDPQKKNNILLWWGLGQTAPKYATLEYWLFWIKMTWETSGTRRTLTLLCLLWKQKINSPCEVYPPYTWKVEGILIVKDKDFRVEKAVQTHYFINVLPQTQTSLSCQFSTNLFFYAEGLKAACFGHLFESHMFISSCLYKVKFVFSP